MQKKNASSNQIAAKRPKEKHGRLPMATLRQQALVFLELELRYQADLAKSGYEPTDARALRDALAQLEQARQSQVHSRAKAKAFTATFRGVLADTAIYRERLIAALKVVSQDAANGFIDPGLLRVGPMGKVASRMIDWLSSVRPLVADLNAALTPFLGANPLQRHDERLALLNKTVGEQLAAQRDLPLHTGPLKEARTELALRIERLWLVARIAFAEKKGVWREFRKRNRQRRVAAAVVPPPAPAEQPAAVADAA